MFFDTLKALVPDAHAAIALAGFSLGGLALGIALRKLLLWFAARLQIEKPNKPKRFRRVLAGTLFEATGRSCIFLFFGIGLIVFKYCAEGVAPLPEGAAGTLARLFWIFLICVIGTFLWHLVKLPIGLIRHYASPKNKSAATLIPLLSALIKIGIIALGILIIIRIATDTQPAEILAMLGIGGLAIGLAAQDSVKNFFGSIMLLLDKPFQVGDTIDIGNNQVGSVEEIGVRSTRIRIRDGSLLSIPNGELANRIVRTITARETIRDELVLGLNYSTSPEQIENGVAILRELLNDPRCILNGGNAPRVYFSNFRDSALEITVVYHFATSNYAEFLRFKHEFCLEILSRFNAAGIDFAFPTQTVYLKREKS